MPATGNLSTRAHAHAVRRQTMTISEKPLYVYLQRPDTHEWVTVGKWAKKADETFGTFVYAPSYLAVSYTHLTLPTKRIV